MKQTEFAGPLKHWPCRNKRRRGRGNNHTTECKDMPVTLTEPKQGRYGTGDRGASSIRRAAG